ncbi:MAG: putative macrolide-specific efflux protein [Gemmatimonadetes bacterium]|nr:putative macrolide-specific efflux protein [Gemmatimonadota bacterium]
MTNKTRIIAAVLTATSLGAALWVHQRADASSTPQYRLGSVERGNIRATVSATGTLGAVRTVEVGTQVSGQISAINVDFNDHVKKGQLIARIDPTLQQQAVQDAQAGVARAQAPLTQAKLEYERNKTLHDQKIVTDVEFNASVSTYAIAKANYTSADISLQKARQNLSYTNIYSPIDGVVVERAMDVGQTVAASLSAPKLFVIANDLSQMQILANVDESDIGLITPDQDVSFSVQSYKDRQFTGKVKQVRLNSTTVNNVVSYTAIISVQNQDGKLLPGMTATAKFVTGSADSVLTVPTTALRFTPPAGAVPVDSAAAKARPTGAGRPAGARPAGTRPAGAGATRGSIWTVDANGVLQKHTVRTGLTDGSRTQIDSKDLNAGAAIVLGTQQAGAAAPGATAATKNPLQPATTGGRGGPPGPF